MRLLDTIEESVIDPNFENVRWDGWDDSFMFTFQLMVQLYIVMVY